jgi:hypothetical protein
VGGVGGGGGIMNWLKISFMGTCLSFTYLPNKGLWYIFVMIDGVFSQWDACGVQTDVLSAGQLIQIVSSNWQISKPVKYRVWLICVGPWFIYFRLCVLLNVTEPLCYYVIFCVIVQIYKILKPISMLHTTKALQCHRKAYMCTVNLSMMATDANRTSIVFVLMWFNLFYIHDLPVEYILVLVLFLHVISKHPHHIASWCHLPRHLNDSFMGFLLLQLRASGLFGFKYSGLSLELNWMPKRTKPGLVQASLIVSWFVVHVQWPW